MVAVAWSIGAAFGVVIGFFIAAMLLYRERVNPSPEMHEHVDAEGN